MAIDDGFLPDPEFIPDAPEDQGKIENAENMLERAIKRSSEVAGSPQELGASFMSGGAPLTGMALGAGQKNIEEGLPSAMQFISGTAGFRPEAGLMALPGSPFLRSGIAGTIGRTGGEVAKQGIQSVVRGKKPSGKRVREEALSGAIGESVGGLMGRATTALFSGSAGKFFQSKAGELLGRVKDEIARRVPKVPAGELVENVGKIVEEANNTVSVTPKGRRALNQFTKELQRVSDMKGGNLEIKDLFNLKRRAQNTLRDVGIFAEKRGGPKVAFDEGSALLAIEDSVDSFIKKVAGNVDPRLLEMFNKSNELFSAVASKFNKKPGAGGVLPDILRANAIINFLRSPFTEDPGSEVKKGAGSLLASEIIESRAGGPIAFGASRGLSRGAPTAISELISQGLKKRK